MPLANCHILSLSPGDYSGVFFLAAEAQLYSVNWFLLDGNERAAILSMDYTFVIIETSEPQQVGQPFSGDFNDVTFTIEEDNDKIGISGCPHH
ncbi:hypothetical protein T265_04005 [Opisthorchis viverrini]|uniref:Uncharacterized protein n=1 Tax=Opisthorchis viverrini TaxID=6198 RepID=A0A075AH43_OPIVI|nr:hypothetical protein T265_04005 [Opisthorchis viverrini]KER29344.1 hypothetical protein T265_04005 [Opisthorchis viverrini]